MSHISITLISVMWEHTFSFSASQHLIEATYTTLALNHRCMMVEWRNVTFLRNKAKKGQKKELLWRIWKWRRVFGLHVELVTRNSRINITDLWIVNVTKSRTDNNDQFQKTQTRCAQTKGLLGSFFWWFFEFFLGLATSLVTVKRWAVAGYGIRAVVGNLACSDFIRDSSSWEEGTG